MRQTTVLLHFSVLFALSVHLGCRSEAPPSEPREAASPSMQPSAQPPRPKPKRPAQPKANDEAAVRFAIISDVNGSYGSTHYSEDVDQAVDRIIELAPDLVVCTGDMVAGQSQGLDYASMWEAFHESVSDRLFDASIPLAVCPGNHDASAFPQYALERLHFRNAWKHRVPELKYL
ncbi:MAG: metallophosphoesterase, partial [Myxococcota bacterium]|nr:metallophosphoesterase [Myxococcota bacterium]